MILQFKQLVVILQHSSSTAWTQRLYSRGSDGSISLQSSRVPYLGFDGLTVQLHRPRAELHADGGAAVVAELILGESREQIALPHARFPYKHH